MASSFRKVCRFPIHMRTGGLRFHIFPPLDMFFKKLRYHSLHFQDPCGRLAKMMQYVYVFCCLRINIYFIDLRYYFCVLTLILFNSSWAELPLEPNMKTLWQFWKKKSLKREKKSPQKSLKITKIGSHLEFEGQKKVKSLCKPEICFLDKNNVWKHV